MSFTEPQSTTAYHLDVILTICLVQYLRVKWVGTQRGGTKELGKRRGWQLHSKFTHDKMGDINRVTS